MSSPAKRAVTAATLPCISATPADKTSRNKAGALINKVVAADHPPHAFSMRPLMHREVAADVTALLVSGALAHVVCGATERLLPFRLAALFGAKTESENVAVTVGSLRKQRTAAARKALACLRALDWQSASPTERRLWIAAAFLRARGDAS